MSENQPSNDPDMAQREHDAQEQVRREGDALPTAPSAAGDELTIALDRYVRLTRRYETEIETVKEQCAAIVRSLESQLRGVDFVYGVLAREAVLRATQNGKSKSVKTPFGTAGFRTVPARLEIDNEGEFLVVAQIDKELAAFVRTETVTKIDRAGLVERFKATGEIPPCCKVTDAAERFYVK